MRHLLVLLSLAAGTAQAAEPYSLRGDAARVGAELGQIRLAQAQDPSLRTAGLEVRLSRLEELLRQLTGRIEEVEYAQRQTAARIDRLVADLDARLPGQPGETSRRARSASIPTGCHARAAAPAGATLDHRTRRCRAAGLRAGHYPPRHA